MIAIYDVEVHSLILFMSIDIEWSVEFFELKSI